MLRAWAAPLLSKVGTDQHGHRGQRERRRRRDVGQCPEGDVPDEATGGAGNSDGVRQPCTRHGETGDDGEQDPVGCGVERPKVRRPVRMGEPALEWEEPGDQRGRLARRDDRSKRDGEHAQHDPAEDQETG